MRYRLRTLLILLAIGPPMVAAGVWVTMNWYSFWLGFSGMMFGY